MNDEEVLRAITAMRLLSAGRYKEAAEWFPSDLLGLQSFVALQARHEIDPPEGVLGDLVRGWANYYNANYPRAFEDFSKAECTKIPWLKAYAWLGKGKVCTDLGFFADAARWCCDASCLARQFEHDDLVAASQGARGEILLRTGHPRLATEAFSLDIALLPASDRFRGRVMCYQAHAYRRLGAYSGAKLAYRTSAQQPGEETAPYAYAGLAMLGAETNDSGLIDEAIRYAEAFYRGTRIHPSVGWVYIAKARFAHQQGEAPLEWLALGKKYLPSSYLFEHQWLANWTALFGGDPAPNFCALARLDNYRPASPSTAPSDANEFDSEKVEAELPNTGFANMKWSTDLESLWEQRELFVF